MSALKFLKHDDKWDTGILLILPDFSIQKGIFLNLKKINLMILIWLKQIKSFSLVLNDELKFWTSWQLVWLKVTRPFYKKEGGSNQTTSDLA